MRETIEKPHRAGILPMVLGLVAAATTFMTVPSAEADILPPRVDVFVRGGDYAIWHRYRQASSSTWSSWESLGGYLTSDPSVVSTGPGRLDVFALDGNHHIVQNTFSSGSWHGWQGMPGDEHGDVCVGGYGGFPECYDFTSAPIVTSWGPGRMDMFVYTHDDDDPERINLEHTWADNNQWSTVWETWNNGKMQGNPGAISWGPGRVDVIVRGGGNELAYQWYDGGSWSKGWQYLLGGTSTTSPAVGTWGPGSLGVFTVDTSGGISYLSFNGGWSQQFLDGASPYGPAVSTWGWGTWDLFVVGWDAALWHRSYNGGSWTAWESLDGSINSSPAAIVWSPSTLPPPPPPPPPPPSGCRVGHPCSQQP